MHYVHIVIRNIISLPKNMTAVGHNTFVMKNNLDPQGRGTVGKILGIPHIFPDFGIAKRLDTSIKLFKGNYTLLVKT
jgi:hypothetical protein